MAESPFLAQGLSLSRDRPFLILTLNGKEQIMALVKFGGGVVQMSGSIAGDTFARNRYGNYVRARTKPVNPNTARQVEVRSAITELTARWGQTLTAAQRTAWNLYGSNVSMKNRLGEAIFLTGFNHYIRSNTMHIVSGMPPIDDGPVVFELPEKDPTISIGISEAAQLLNVTYDDALPYADEDGGRMFLFCGVPQNAQRNFFAGPYRYYGQVIGVNGAPPAPPHVAAPPFVCSETQHIWCKFRISRADGRLSEIFRADTFCVA